MIDHTCQITTLRRVVAKIDGTQKRLSADCNHRRMAVGISAIDRLLGGGLAPGDVHEVRCSWSRDIGCAAGFVLGLLSGLNDERPLVWIADPETLSDTGTVFPHGLASFGIDASRLLHIRPMRLNDCLWAAGEAGRTGGLAAVVLHVKDNPAALDLAVSRKLRLRAQKSGTPFFVLRQAGAAEASGVTTRWHIAPAPSLPDEIYPGGLGHMRLILTLEKNRNGQTGEWLIAWNPKTRAFEHAAQQTGSAHYVLSFSPSRDRPGKPSALGHVVAGDWKQQKAS